MTARRIAAHGLLAGLGVCEMRTLSPGFILDTISVRTRYDMAMHGIRLKKMGGEW